jgi:hypothetical protein
MGSRLLRVQYGECRWHSITKELNLAAFQREPLWDDVGFVAGHLLNADTKMEEILIWSLDQAIDSYF